MSNNNATNVITSRIPNICSSFRFSFLFSIFDFCRWAPRGLRPLKTVESAFFFLFFFDFEQKSRATLARRSMVGAIDERKINIAWNVNGCDCDHIFNSRFHRLIHNNLFIASISGVCTRSHTHRVDILTISATAAIDDGMAFCFAPYERRSPSESMRCHSFTLCVASALAAVCQRRRHFRLRFRDSFRWNRMHRHMNNNTMKIQIFN